LTLPTTRGIMPGMANHIRIIKHEAVPNTGSFEVRFPDGRPPKYFYWDDEPSRRLRPEQVDRKTALEAAKALARSERDKLIEPIALPCPRCDGCRWVCETHRDTPWEGPRACNCGGAGAPCPVCNQGTEPEMSADFVADKRVRDLD
jgi:hypothetical protein